MDTQSRYFPYEMSIVINGLYDTIEALGLSLDSSNSARGTLIVSDMEKTIKMRIAVQFDITKNQTQVAVFPDDVSADSTRVWGRVILDELAGRMKRLNQLRRSEQKNEN